MAATTPADSAPPPEPDATPGPARRRWWLIAILAVLVFAIGGGATFVWLRLAKPVPAPVVTQTIPAEYVLPGVPPVLPWPLFGQATMEIEGIGALGSSGGTRPVPIASVAKVMTAYLILQDHPLGTAEDGPTITVSAQEAAEYAGQVTAGLSLVKVVAGEVLTERQALVALLLPSADNVAQILARWDAGSPAAFVTKMNVAATQLEMADTRYTDASGLDAGTVSTAVDQVKLARRALAVPTLAQIVALPEATIPVAGLVKNYNTLLGQDGIVGVKTGSTNAAGGCLVFAARVDVDGQPVTILGAVLGQTGAPNRILGLVLAASQKLVQAAAGAVHTYPVVPAGQVLATVRGPLDTGTTLAATSGLSVLGWPGLTYRIAVRATVPTQVAPGTHVGTVNLTGPGISTGTDLVTTSALRPPSPWQRITHG
jgi:D-alanyl-D-alanine carboxypeptidase (penicillin-binding protein 5/6)